MIRQCFYLILNTKLIIQFMKLIIEIEYVIESVTLEDIMKSSKLLNHFFHLLPVLFGVSYASNGSIGRRFYFRRQYNVLSLTSR